MVMKALREGASGGILKFILFGFLALAVGGLVLMDMGGFFRGGIASTDVASVGDKKIHISSFDRTVRRTLSRIGMSQEQAWKLGYIYQILNAEIRMRLMHQAAQDKGIMIGEDIIAAHIKTLITPLTGAGQNPRDVLDQILMSQGISEGEFIAGIRQDMASSLIQRSVKSGFNAVDPQMARALYKHKKETRQIEYLHFPITEIQNTATPDENTLREIYEAMKKNYARPEIRSFKLIRLDTSKLKETMAISEEELRQTYEENIDLYTQPEQKTLAQALLSTEETALKTVKALKKGQSLKKAVQDVTGNENAYLGEESFSEARLQENLETAVKAADTPGAVIGPVQSPLGWHVLVLKGITPAQTKSFQAVKDEIRAELLENRLIDEQYELAGLLDDILASGAALQEAADEVDIKIEDLPPVNRYGLSKQGENIFERFAHLKDTLLETGFMLEEGEATAVMEVPGGDFAALYVDKITPETYTPFEKVKKELEEQWVKDQKRTENRQNVTQALERIKQDKLSLKAYATNNNRRLRTLKNLKRNQDAGIFTAKSVSALFHAMPHDPLITVTKEGLAIAEITQVDWPADHAYSGDDFESFKETLHSTQKDVGLALFLAQAQKTYGVTINHDLLRQTYGPAEEQR